LATRRPAFGTADRVIALLTEVPAAVLVGLEILILLAGVISRYVFNSPLTWSDELASILFLWLAMLGAVIALRRGEHMRLTTFLGRAGPQWRGRLEALGAVIVALFLLLILGPALDYFEGEAFITTPALEIPNSI